MLAKRNLLAFPLFLVLVLLWWYSLNFIPSDVHQGDIYKIIYLHVPCAFSAFFCSFILFVLSIMYLFTKAQKYAFLARSTAEIGCGFTLLTLLTGSIWGRSTWGVWWTWDARLTTTFLLGVLYVGYLLLVS